MNIFKILLGIVIIIVAICASIGLYNLALACGTVTGMAMGAVLICGWIGAAILGIVEFIAWRK